MHPTRSRRRWQSGPPRHSARCGDCSATTCDVCRWLPENRQWLKIQDARRREALRPHIMPIIAEDVGEIFAALAREAS